MYIIADMFCYLDEFPPNIDGELHLLILLIPEEKFTEGMDEYEDFDPNAPGVSLSQPIPTGWKYKAVKLPGEVAFVSEEFGPVRFGLTYRPNNFPHEAVREFIENTGLNKKKNPAGSLISNLSVTGIL